MDGGNIWRTGTADRRPFDQFNLGERFAPPPQRARWAGSAGLVAHSLAHRLDGLERARLVAQSSRFAPTGGAEESLRLLLQVVALQPSAGGGVVVLRSTTHSSAGTLLLDGEQHYWVSDL